MSIGERITELRKASSLSQGQLAQDLGVSRQAISKWENDQSSPDTLNLIRLSERLNTEVEYLATGKKPVYEPTPIIVNLVEKHPEKVVEKIVKVPVEKPVIRKVVRKVVQVQYRADPKAIGFGILFGFLFGLFIGLMF